MFPVRAGMSPLLCSSLATTLYVPRASGDEPLRGRDALKTAECSPHGRG